MTTEEKKQRFITKSIELWGYKYDYSRVDYIDNTTPVTIGYKDIWYKQTPSKHLQGKKIEMQERRMPTENFIAMSKKVWGQDRFDYSECEYLGNTKKVKLYDKVKKRWIEQSPKSHLKGFEVTKLTAQEFVNECDIIYENKYTYDTSGYVNLHSRVKLICLEHGVSEKKASSILYTSGCSKCVSTKCISQAINLLKSKSISYIHNYKFDDLDIPFKIYIPAYRTCIEFDSRVDKDELLKERDALKQSYCEDNYIDLIRIRYDQLNKVDDILWNSLKGKLVFQ